MTLDEIIKAIEMETLVGGLDLERSKQLIDENTELLYQDFVEYWEGMQEIEPDTNKGVVFNIWLIQKISNLQFIAYQQQNAINNLSRAFQMIRK